MAKCTAVRLDGTACKANAKGHTPWCRWHDPSDEARAEHRAQSRAGGIAKAATIVVESAEPLANDPAVRALDLATADGVRGLLAATLRALTTLHVDVRLANALANLTHAQRASIEQVDVVERIEALEAAERLRQKTHSLRIAQ